MEYLFLVCAASKGSEQQCTFFDTFFGQKLKQGRSFEELLRLTNHSTLTRNQKIFIPILLGEVHWTLFVADTPTKEVQFFDSGVNFGYSKGIEVEAWRLIVFMRQWARHVGMPDLESAWTWSRKDSCQQQNGDDCGCYVLGTARCLAENRELTSLMQPQNMNYFRRAIMLELSEGCLTPLF